MRARVESLSPRAVTALAAAATLLFLVAAWFLVVSPKRADASAAAAELTAAENRLADAQAALLRPRASGASAADVLSLAKAMPSGKDQAGLVLEITRLARASGVTLEGITPQKPPLAAGGPTSMPVSVVVNGRYYEIARFLKRTRMLVRVRNGNVLARGRVLSVKSVSLIESDTGAFPQLDATIEIGAYVYDGPMAPVEVPSADEDEDVPPTGGSAAAGSGS